VAWCCLPHCLVKIVVVEAVCQRADLQGGRCRFRCKSCLVSPSKTVGVADRFLICLEEVGIYRTGRTRAEACGRCSVISTQPFVEQYPAELTPNLIRGPFAVSAYGLARPGAEPLSLDPVSSSYRETAAFAHAPREGPLRRTFLRNQAIAIGTIGLGEAGRLSDELLAL
jgi:hypothetical protein